MKKFLPILLLSFLSLACDNKSVDIRAYGAHPGKDCTEAIQAAIRDCPAGGKVIVPRGIFPCGSIVLKDSIELHLNKGAVLQGLPSIESYSPCIPDGDYSKYDSGNGTLNANSSNDSVWMKAFIMGCELKDVTISGPGSIDGMHVFNPLGEENMRGPHAIIIAGAKNFTMKGVRILRAANYAFLGYALENARFEDLEIEEGWDGIHIRGGLGVSIVDCSFKTGDDSIAGGYWEDMIIQGCDINSSCNGIRMIMPSKGVLISDSYFHGPGVWPHRTTLEKERRNMLFGISLEPGAWGPASGEMSGIVLRDLKMENMDAAVASSVREGSVARDLTIDGLQGRGLKSSSPLVSWNDLGWESITVSRCRTEK